MRGELHIDLSTVYGFLLALARVAGAVAFVPIPGFSAGPEASRIVFALAVTVTLFPAWPAPVVAGLSVGRCAGWIGAEALFGLAIGVAIAFLLEGIQLAAQAIGLQAGYSFASTVDPNTQADSTSLQVLAQLFAGCLFLALGFDREIIRVLASSLSAIPAGSYSLDLAHGETIARLGSGIFSIGLQLAFPVMALVLLIDLAIAVLGRLQTQLQVLSLSFAVKMLAAVAFLASLLALFPAVFEKAGVATLRALIEVLEH